MNDDLMGTTCIQFYIMWPLLYKAYKSIVHIIDHHQAQHNITTTELKFFLISGK